MAVLVQGFTLVIRAAAVDERFVGGWPALADLLADRSVVTDGELVAIHCGDRSDWLELLSAFAERGFQEDFEKLAVATAISPVKLRTEEEITSLQELGAGVDSLALVYRKQARQPRWLDLKVGSLPKGGPVVAGAALVGGAVEGLALPEGWAPVDAIPEREEPENGDEMLPTWHELLASMSPSHRLELMRFGPDAYQAFTAGIRGPRLFAGPIRAGGLVIERESFERRPAGAERRVVDRWIRFPRPIGRPAGESE